MKILIAMVLAAGAFGSAVAQPSVGISIGINQPGIYGRINIGDLPRAALVLPQPVIIAPPTLVVERRPIYLYVPAAHQRGWHHYCGRYNACGQPVYFVHDQWVRDRYEREHPGWNRDRSRGPDRRIHDRRGDGHDQGRGQRRERDRNNERERRD